MLVIQTVGADGWSKEAIELIEDVTMCAKWEPVMVKVIDYKSNPPLVTIVNTNNNQVSLPVIDVFVLLPWLQDIDVATKLNAFVNQLPQQQELVDETVTMKMSPTQLESSVNMFDDQDMLQLNDQSGKQDDQHVQQQSNHDDQEFDQNDKNLQQVDETVVMEMSTQFESSINTFDEVMLQQLDDHNSDQDDQCSKDPVTITIQQSDRANITSDQDDVTSAYEVQGVSVTFDSDSEEDDEVVTIQVEEDINETWLHSTSHPTEFVSVTIATTEHTSKRIPNCVNVTPLL